MERRNQHRGKSHMAESKQLLHFVFGGELTHTDEVEFRDLSKLDFVGMYPNYAEAERAWRARAQSTVDNAQMRYFVVHIHRLMDPDEEHDH
jgi:hypothetical protein